MQKRVYFHREEAGAPHFTCLVKLTVDDPRTLAELAALTAQQYTMRCAPNQPAVQCSPSR
jgi:hypothetical protein